MSPQSRADGSIRAAGLVRRFDDFTAVDGIDLDIPAGEIYGFLGPNGAGKSTTVRVLCTLITPDGGTATVAGYDVATRPDQVRLHIGVALQDAALDPKQTGSELLRLQARLYGLNRRETSTRLREVRQLVDIGDAMDRPIGTYSGGMKRRLDLAAALIHNPEILFLDEPTTGLDPVSRAAVWEEVRRLNTDLGTTIFLTTQYLEEADELADRVGILADGELVAEGPPDELKRSVGEDVIIARIEGPADAAVAAVTSVGGVTSAEVHGDELTIAATDGASVISPVAVALERLRREGARSHAAHHHPRRRVPRAHRQPHRAHRRRHPRGGRPVTAITAHDPLLPSAIRARPSGFLTDLASVAGRALRSIPREPAEMIPALMIPLFFFVVNVGALQDFSEQGIAGFDYKAFQLPVAIIFAVTGVSRAGTLVLDIQDGYFDRLLMTPVKRLALLLGLMIADLALVCGLCIPVMGLGFALGVRFETGLLRHAGLHPARRVLGRRLHGVPLRDRPQDR